MPPITERFDQGQVESRDPMDLRPGELQSSRGAEYKKDDSTRIHKQRGRSTFGTVKASAKVKGVYLAQFDTATDLLVALAAESASSDNDSLYTATAGASGTFTENSDATGTLDVNATKLDGAHYNDRHYLANGYDRNQVIESDGGIYTHGMFPGQQRPAVTTAAGASTILRADADDGDFDNGGNAWDAGADKYDTFAGATRSTAGNTDSIFTFPAGTNTASHTIRVLWGLAGFQRDPTGDNTQGTGWNPAVETGTEPDSGFNVTISLEISENSGTSWTTFYQQTFTGSEPKRTTQKELTDSLDSGVLQMRATITYNSGTNPATLRIYDVRIQAGGSSVSNFSITTGLVYGYTEFDQTRNEESPISIGAKVTGSTINTVTLDFTNVTQQNSRATHRNIYRTVDGGTYPIEAWRIDTIPIDQNTWIDDFETYDKDTTSGWLVEMLIISDKQKGDIPIPIDQPPPAFARIGGFKGHMWGIQRNSRALRYSVAGRPNSWPEIYVISAFFLEENDILVDAVDLGGTLLIMTKEAALRIDVLPRVISGLFDASPAERIDGAPGLISEYGLAKYNVAGEPRAAWISPYGIYATNTQTIARISDDLDWDTLEPLDKSRWVLHWDQERLVLVFACRRGGTGENNRYYLFHMSPMHQKANGQPKVTGPHFGSYAGLASGQVGTQHRLYSAHPSDGKVYTEKMGNTDDSNSEDSSGTWTMDLKSRRINGNGSEIAAFDAFLHHSDFGKASTADVEWTWAREQVSGDDGVEKTISKTVSLSRQRETQFAIDRSGEWHEIRVKHTGAQSGSLRQMRFNAEGAGETGLTRGSSSAA